MSAPSGERLRRHAAAAGARLDRLPGAALTRDVLQRERMLGGMLLEAGVAFRMFLWLVPFGLVVAALLSLWSDVDPASLEHSARRLGLTAVAARAATRAIHESDRGIPYLLGFGLVMLAWFTLGAVRAVVLGYALAWRETPPRIARPVLAVAAFNGIFVVCVASSSLIASLRTRGGIMLVLGTVVSLAVMVGVALAGMRMLPHSNAQARDLLPGAVLIAVGYQLEAVAVVVWFAPKLGRSEATYGAFGAAATLLLWLYVLARLVIGAAFLNAVVHARRTVRA